PQFISISDGSWLGTSACMERMTQMSSMQEATWGKISLTSMPLLPWRGEIFGRGEGGPGRRAALVLGRGRAGPARPGGRRRGVERGGGVGVEGVEVRRPAVHEQVQDALGLAGEVRLFWRQRVDVGLGGAEQPLRAEQAGEAEGAHAHAGAAEQVAAGQQRVVE